MSSSPIKRIPELTTLSREHHHGLQLSWKIRTGIAKNISVERIATYAKWFYLNHLLPHFDIEEKYVFPVLGDSDLIKKALEQHNHLRDLFNNEPYDIQTLNDIEKSLTEHIRFEERVLFNEIQKIANKDQLRTINDIHGNDVFIENDSDSFWK